MTNLRAAILLRYTGLRIGQVLRLEWRDFDLDRATLSVRGELGKSRQEKRGRLIPISPYLVEAMKGWGVREGRVVPGKPSPSSCAGALRKAWLATAAAGFARPEVFERRPDHAFRRAFTSELKRAKAEDEAVEYLVGHGTPGARASYLDPDCLELREAVALVAAIGTGRGPTPLRPRSVAGGA